MPKTTPHSAYSIQWHHHEVPDTEHVDMSQVIKPCATVGWDHKSESNCQIE